MIQRQERPEPSATGKGFSWEVEGRLPPVAPEGDATAQLSNLPGAKTTSEAMHTVTSVPQVEQTEEAIAHEHHLARIAELRAIAAKLRDGGFEKLNSKIEEARQGQRFEKVEGEDYGSGALFGVVAGLLGGFAVSALFNNPNFLLAIPASPILVASCMKIWAVLEKHQRMRRAVDGSHQSLKPEERQALAIYNSLNEGATKKAKDRDYSEDEKSRVLKALLMDHAVAMEKQADQLDAPPVIPANRND